MPTYVYQCQKCQAKLEREQKITADPMVDCPECQAPELKRIPAGGGGLLFRGTGYYATDYGPLKRQNDCGKSTCACKE